MTSTIQETAPDGGMNATSRIQDYVSGRPLWRLPPDGGQHAVGRDNMRCRQFPFITALRMASQMKRWKVLEDARLLIGLV
jgi:hypothetical protein